MLYALMLLTSLGFIWGSGYTLARFAITAGVPPLGYALWQTLGPVVLLSFIKLLQSKPIRPRYYHLFTGIFGIAFPNTNMYFAARHIPAGLLAVLVNTVPIFTYCLALLFRAERFAWQRMLAVGLGVVGILFVLQQSFSLGEIKWYWGLVLLTPLSFACTALYINRSCQAEDNLNLAWGMLLVAGLALAPLTFGKGDAYALHWPLLMPDYAILTEILLSTLGYLIFFELLKVASAVYYSLVGGVVAITGLFWGWLILGEILTPWQGLGTLIIIAAIILLTTSIGKTDAGRS